MKSILIERKQRSWKLTESDFEARIRTQEWPTLHVNEDSMKRKCVYTGENRFVDGEIVCDYHREIISLKQGQRRFNSYDDSSGNYHLYFQHNSKCYCVGASKIPCEFHQDIESTTGRLINHSRKMPNLKPLPSVLSGELLVSLIPITNIPPLTELCSD
jgi:nitrite reductase/ring-hydroxylating ferredoxin subunit